MTVINGTKLVILSGNGKSPLGKRIKYFIGGLCLIAASSFIIFASTVYNQAIATSNTDLISNAVIILFITDIDEMAYALQATINPKEDSEVSQKLTEEIESLLKDEKNKWKLEWVEEMKSLLEDEKSKWKLEWAEEMKVEPEKQVTAERKKIWENNMKTESEKQGKGLVENENNK